VRSKDDEVLDYRTMTRNAEEQVNRRFWTYMWPRYLNVTDRRTYRQPTDDSGADSRGGVSRRTPPINLPQTDRLLVGTVYCQYKVCGNVLTVDNYKQRVSLMPYTPYSIVVKRSRKKGKKH